MISDTDMPAGNSFPVNYSSFNHNNIKERSFVPNLVTCYSKDAQREWIKLKKSRKQKCKFLKKCANDFSQGMEEFRSCVKYRYRIIGRLISIEVL